MNTEINPVNSAQQAGQTSRDVLDYGGTQAAEFLAGLTDQAPVIAHPDILLSMLKMSVASADAALQRAAQIQGGTRALAIVACLALPFISDEFRDGIAKCGTETGAARAIVAMLKENGFSFGENAASSAAQSSQVTRILAAEFKLFQPEGHGDNAAVIGQAFERVKARLDGKGGFKAWHDACPPLSTRGRKPKPKADKADAAKADADKADAATVATVDTVENCAAVMKAAIAALKAMNSEAAYDVLRDMSGIIDDTMSDMVDTIG